jgi:hypothetical protein
MYLNSDELCMCKEIEREREREREREMLPFHLEHPTDKTCYYKKYNVTHNRHKR